jgi:hypothetical protein
MPNNTAEPGQSAQPERWTFSRNLKVFDGLLTLVSAVGLVFLGIQSCELQRQNQYTQQLLQQNTRANEVATGAQRAYVNLQAFDQGTRLLGANKTVVSVRIPVPWENSGTTPAKNVTTRISWQPYPDAIREDFSFRDLPVSGKQTETRYFSLGPKARTTNMATINIEYFRRAMQGEHLYVWGWVTYNDIFPGTPLRLTQFCREVINIRITGDATDITQPAAALTFETTSCPGRFSCYDEDCPDYKARIKQAESLAPS